MAKSDTNPHLTQGSSPLQALIMQAIRRYGEFAPGTVDGDTNLMFIEFANMVLDEVRGHPYHDGTVLDYYEALTDSRPVPDPIIVAGLLHHYAMQQSSQKVQFLMPSYFRTLNQLLWNKLSGAGRIQLRVVDGGTSPRNSADVSTNPVTGMPE